MDVIDFSGLLHWIIKVSSKAFSSLRRRSFLMIIPLICFLIVKRTEYGTGMCGLYKKG